MRTSGNLDSSSSSGGLGTCPVGLGTQRDNGRPYGTCAGRRGTVAFPLDDPWPRVRRTTTRPSPARPTQASRQPDRGLVNARGHGYWYGSRTLRVAISCDDVASSPCARTIHGPRAAQLCRCGTGCPFRPPSSSRRRLVAGPECRCEKAAGALDPPYLSGILETDR
jgi:hypothetical protein